VSALADKKEVTKGQPNAIVRFYRETVGELKKVSWPTREEAINLTMLVIVVLFVMALFLGAIDLLGATVLEWLFTV
jgi:preprotein translocase subunit SecE